MELHLLDMSNYLYAGRSSQKFITRGVRETDGAYAANRAPIGAVKYCLDQVRTLMGSNSIVMPVFDSTPTIKREMYERTFGDPYGYKAGRRDKPKDFNPTRDYIEWILRDIGFPVQRAEGYESDDIIYTLVEMFKDDYERIYVHTKDSDLYFLVSDNVEIAPVGMQGKVVDLSNYSNVVNKEVYVWYNTIHLHKLYGGDKSDNIPGVGWSWSKFVDDVIPVEDYRKLGDLDLVRKYLREASRKFPMEPKAHLLTSVFDIVCPLSVPEDLIDNYEVEIDMNKFDNYYMLEWAKQNDRWDLEDRLLEYIDSFYE